MAIITADCPHCNAKNMTFLVFGAQVTEKNRDAGLIPLAAVAAECRSCSAPVVALYRAANGEVRPDGLQQRLTHAMQQGRELDDAYVVRMQLWPEPRPLEIPGHLPPDVERAFSQGEVNFSQPHCEEAAALMYRRALEVGLKTAYPHQSGSLASRIRELVSEHHLPAAIGEWLDQVRLIGNDGAHDVDGVSREDLEAARGFVDMALRYIFTLPAQVTARRGTPTAVA